jgi:hypothetical protein
MVEGGIWPLLIPAARTIAGFCVGVMLGICGGWAATVFNAFIEYPWSPAVHLNLYVVCIGLGGGLGAYCGWVMLGFRWYLFLATIILALAGGVLGAYLGQVYGGLTEPSYLGRSYTIDSWLHFGAPIGGIVVASSLGIYNYVRNLGR